MFSNTFFGPESQKVETYHMGSNKQVFSFSKTVGRIGREIRNTSKSGRESRESRNVSNGVEQQITIFQKLSVE